MSKKETKTALPVVVRPNLQALEGVSDELKQRVLDIKDNLESVEDMRLPRAKNTSQGFELIEGDEPLTELIGVIVHTRKTNVYYAKPYNRKELTPPDCFSLDGETPDKSIEKPVSKSCRGCPMAEFGTNSMKSGKACRNLKPLYMLLGDEAIMPRQVIIAPTSLRAANGYLMNLTERGLSYRKVLTKITAFKKDPEDTYMTLKFEREGALTPQRMKDVEALRLYWLGAMNSQVVDQTEVEPVREAKDSGEY